ncbi:hypothetical protein DYB26_012988 [Aphanomyces astaci]|uniref:Oxoglutarate/iron-dependent oxygenase C-terminal degradation domain-containing protein n=1 Tax=Aphanomyces astaci TaxID=112090 RepID=A0A418D946_APHAT|nr:hypothetical protein DYB26_012988 [Aphanomyces astaci]
MRILARPTQCQTYPFWPQQLISKYDWALTSKECEGVLLDPTSDADIVPNDRILKETVIHEVHRSGESMTYSEIESLVAELDPDMLHAFDQLQSFLTAQWASAIDTATRAADSADQLGHGKVPAYTAGYSTDDSNHWTPQGPLFLQRYLRYTGAAPAASEVLKLQSSLTDAKDVNTTKAGATPPAPSSPGRLLAHVQTALVQSPAFVKWLSLATGVSPTGSRSEVRRLRPGLDYTLAHQATTSSPPIILDAVLCFCDDVSQEGDDEAPWSASGFECYMRAVADGVGDVAAAAFNGEDSTDEDDDAAPVQIGAQNNTLSLVVRDTSTMKFVKFVSCRERGSRWDVNVEYTLPNP